MMRSRQMATTSTSRNGSTGAMKFVTSADSRAAASVPMME
jgi:hypothetical protein